MSPEEDAALRAALAAGTASKLDRRRWLLLLIGLFGAALLYGGGMITPVDLLR